MFPLSLPAILGVPVALPFGTPGGGTLDITPAATAVLAIRARDGTATLDIVAKDSAVLDFAGGE